jgi:hypothetical protein
MIREETTKGKIGLGCSSATEEELLPSKAQTHTQKNTKGLFPF